MPAKKHRREACLRIAIFGASGHLGAEIARKLLKRSESEMGVFVMPKTRELLDLMDLQMLYSWLWYARPNVVVWAAVEQHGNNDRSWRINVEAVDLVSKFCALHGAFFVYISCHSVFSGYKSCPPDGIHEAMPVYPVCGLGQEIVAAENCILRAGQIMESRRNGFSYVILRTGPLFGGPQERPAALVPSLLSSCEMGRTLFRVSSTVASPAYVPHVADLVIYFIDNHKKVCPGIYHVANKGRCTEAEFCYEIAASQGYTICILETPDASLWDGSLFTCAESGKLLSPQVLALDCAKLAMLNKSLPTWQHAVREYLRDRRHAFSIS